MTNVVLITIDSLRADHIGCYGYDRETSPNVDTVAASGHRFTNAFAHAGATRPSFPSILTSSYALMYGGFERISEDRILISELLEDAGYQTAGFHSNLFLSADFGYDRGFETFYDSKSAPSLTARLRQYVKRQFDSESLAFQFLKRAFEATEKHAGVEIGSAYVRADDLTDLACQWLEDAETESPVFLWTHYMDVHHPYLPPTSHQREFRDEPIDDRRATQLRRKMLEEPDAITVTELEAIVDLYDAEIRFTDAQIGRLLERVYAELEGETVVIITADHGEELADHGKFSHNTVKDEGIHVPLVVDDGQTSGVHDELVGLLDVAPTIADYAGQPLPEEYYGHSLRRLATGDDWPRSSIIGDWDGSDGRRFFYRDRDWKFIQRPGEQELYDLDQDPDERRNVLDEHDEVVHRLRAIIRDHEREVDETYRELGEIEIDETVRERLERLGYTDQ